MQFSTETITQIQEIIVADFNRQMETEGTGTNNLEQALRSLLQKVGQSSYGELLSQMDEQQNGIEEACRQCGEKSRRVSKRATKVLSVFGWSNYRRSYYHCSDCQYRWAALDTSQGLRAGQATPLMRGLLALAGITVSFEEAAQQIEQYLQVQVSANMLRQETQLIGAKQAEREQKWIDESQDLKCLQIRERNREVKKRLYGSIDGAFVPLEKEWKEAKTVCWYQQGQRYGKCEPHATDIHYYTSLEPAEAFGKLLWGSGVHHHADQAAELVFVCDGAVWIWNLVSHYFPQAIQIVDWYHACQYLHAVADALELPATEHETWLSDMKTLLWEGDVESVIQTCQPLVDQAEVPVKRLLSYYQNNLERMRYATFREQQYFIGSGTVESGCKQIVSMRLKRSGARWTEHGATMTAKARTAWLSNSWSDITQLPLAV